MISQIVIVHKMKIVVFAIPMVVVNVMTDILKEIGHIHAQVVISFLMIHVSFVKILMVVVNVKRDFK